MEKTLFINSIPGDSFTYKELRLALEEKGYALSIAHFPQSDTPSILAACRGCCGVICNGEAWDRAAIDAVKGHARIFVRHGVGVDSIDAEYAAACGIPLYNVGDANASAVAEVALFHILGALRKCAYAANEAKAGRAYNIGNFFGHELSGKTVGLIGAGNIGRRLARMLRGFEVTLLAFDPFVDPALAAQAGITLVSSMDEVFRRADVVSLHIPCTLSTKGSIGRALFNQMKPGACLVNTCRGGVINEADLLDGLQKGLPCAAGLDVVMSEPVRPEDPLCRRENVTVTPHIGANSFESIGRYAAAIADTVEGFFSGRPCGNLLNPAYLRHSGGN